MTSYSTIFFVDGAPVGYAVTRQDNRRILLNPAENALRSSEAPRITAEWNKGQWQVKGTHNQQLIGQVLEELNRNKNWLAQNIMAAP